MQLGFKTVEYRSGALRMLDQRRLPGQVKYLTARNARQISRAIRFMVVRGAPLIGVVAAWGAVIEAVRRPDRDLARHLRAALKLIQGARPTAQNLFWACERMAQLVERFKTNPGMLRKRLLAEARRIEKEDIVACEKIGRFGAALVKNRARIMVHCNAGALATAGIGTALGVLYRAGQQGKNFTVYACETRPLLQGARLTVWELLRNRIDTYLICDNMAANFIGGTDLVLVGADRIAANGDTANKIGTRGLAIIARQARVPFYVAAPMSTFDPAIKDGSRIPIERRPQAEVTAIAGHLIAPRQARALNPAFDVTPHQLITGIITDRGIIRPPYIRSIKKAFDGP